MKNIIIFFLVMLLFLSSGVASHATNSTETTTMGSVLEASVTVSESPDPYNQYGINENGGLPNVTINEASIFLRKKGEEVVRFLQTAIQPFIVVLFIIFAILMIVGAVGNSQLFGKGLVGMIIATVVFILIVYSPQILTFIVNWAGSPPSSVS